MKKISFILLGLLVSIAPQLFSQLKVNSVGNTLLHSSGFEEDRFDTNSKLTIKTSRDYGLYVFKSGSTLASTNWSNGINGNTEIVNNKFNVGVRGDANTTATSASGRAFGLLGVAGNSTSGYNYGIMGCLFGNGNGTAVYGAIGSNHYGNPVPGRYSGYFENDIMVTGTINGTVIGNSDIRLKENVVELSSGKALDNILKMHPIEYNLKQQYLELDNTISSDTGSVKMKMFDETLPVFQKKQYGLSAQELQQLYPDLVYEQQSGYLGINYIGLIPILIQSIKELKEELDEVKEENRSLQLRAATDITSTTSSQVAVLYQNNPNPFSQTTQIKYYLPADVKNASLCIYDLQGKQLKQYAIAASGEGYQEISGDEVSAGIYLYALIADGKEVDIKRMILTE
ncbi:MAG: tail fiber domain-containing protein [Candidatus Azobacteroides sp.]|nr:tail fiber domain-containing protein [Candidatus Azobacteroides sp.]